MSYKNKICKITSYTSSHFSNNKDLNTVHEVAVTCLQAHCNQHKNAFTLYAL